MAHFFQMYLVNWIKYLVLSSSSLQHLIFILYCTIVFHDANISELFIGVDRNRNARHNFMQKLITAVLFKWALCWELSIHNI